MVDSARKRGSSRELTAEIRQKWSLEPMWLVDAFWKSDYPCRMAAVRSKKLTVMLSAEEEKWLAELALERGLSKSDYVRQQVRTARHRLDLERVSAKEIERG